MRTDLAVFAVTGLLVFIVYLFTSAPGLGLVDSGELTTVGATLSIAHPTGYPLWTILAHLWQAVLPISAARAMVLFSVTCGALACGILSVVAWYLLRSAMGATNGAAVVISTLLGTTFGLSGAIWSSVAFAEVYPLTLLLTAVLLAIAILQWQASTTLTPMRAAAIACFVWGLGLGNHLTILWFIPLIVWLVWHAVGHTAGRGLPILLLGGMFALGASVNLFLPIRSSVDPLLDWSDPQNLPGLLRHLSAWQYRVWMFKGNFSGFVTGFLHYLGTLPQDIGWPWLLLSVIGVVRALLRKTWMMLVFLLCWLIGVAYNLNYSIPDISTYFVSFYAPLFMVAVYGFSGIFELVPSRGATLARKSFGVGTALIALGITAGSSFGSADHHTDTFAADHALAVLGTLPDSAVVLQGNWDIQSPVMYLQAVEHVRPDVVMLDLALMQRPWYLKQEQRRHPGVFAGAQTEIAAFKKAVAPFESGEPYSGSQIEAAYVGMVNIIIENNWRIRPVYIRDTRSVGHPNVAAKFPSYPGGYFFRIGDARREEPMLEPDRLLRFMPKADERERYLFDQMGAAAAMQGSFAMDLQDTLRVRQAMQQAETLAPGSRAIERFVIQARMFLTGTIGAQ